MLKSSINLLCVAITTTGTVVSLNTVGNTGTGSSYRANMVMTGSRNS